MKLNGIVGKGSGKLGASVFAISGGEQIVRQYNPQVSNPSTDAQVAQRAKLKLMSQLAAALAPGLGFKKQGLISARNQFVSKNIGQCTMVAGKATVGIQDLMLTPGSFAAPNISLSRAAQGNNIVVTMSEIPAHVFDKIVLVSVERIEDSNLNLIEVKVVDADNNGAFTTAEVTATEFAAAVYAYGVLAGSAKSSATYENTVLDTSETQANLGASIMNSVRNATLSTTTCGLLDAVG